MGLLDTGADINVLPYQVGLELGAVWEDQQTSLRLSGNLANFEARGLLLEGFVGNLPSVRLAFAWTSTDSAPLILGQVNFFQEFDVCFFGSQKQFEIRIKTTT